MAEAETPTAELVCHNCGYTDVRGGDWLKVQDPMLGSLTQCPNCSSTRVEQRVE